MYKEIRFYTGDSGPFSYPIFLFKKEDESFWSVTGDDWSGYDDDLEDVPFKRYKLVEIEDGEEN